MSEWDNLPHKILSQDFPCISVDLAYYKKVHAKFVLLYQCNLKAC